MKALKVCLLLGLLAVSVLGRATKHGENIPGDGINISENQLEREALASVAEDIHLAELDKIRGETEQAEGQNALALSKQDVANGEIDKVNAETDEAKAKKDWKPKLGHVGDLAKADAKMGKEDYEAAKEMHETAKEDVEVVGKEDIQNGIEDKKNAEQFMEDMRKFEHAWNEGWKRDKENADKDRARSKEDKERVDDLKMNN